MVKQKVEYVVEDLMFVFQIRDAIKQEDVVNLDVLFLLEKYFINVIQFVQQKIIKLFVVLSYLDVNQEEENNQVANIKELIVLIKLDQLLKFLERNVVFILVVQLFQKMVISFYKILLEIGFYLEILLLKFMQKSQFVKELKRIKLLNLVSY